MLNKLQAGLILGVVAWIVVVSGIHGSLGLSAISFLSVTLLCSLAYPLCRFLFGPGMRAIIFTFPIGFLIHSFCLALLGWAWGIHPFVFLLYLPIAILLSVLCNRKLPRSETVAFEKQPDDTWVLAAWLILTAAILTPAFLNVGTETPFGFAFRAYFNTDVFRNMATSGSLLRTGIPPENPYMAGFPMRYYWLFHVIPAFWIKFFPAFPVQSLFVQFTMIVSLSFAAIVWAAARTLCKNSIAPLWLLPLFLAGGSYEGLYVLRELSEKKMHWTQFTNLNVDGILRWVAKLPQVDALYRPMLYAPQHLLAVLVLPALLLAWNGSMPFFRKMVLLSLAFVSVGFSVIVGAIVVLGAAVLMFLEAIQQKIFPWRLVLLSGMTGVLFLTLYVFGFQMFSLHHGDLQIAIDPNLMQYLPSFFFLQWGAILIVGLAGVAFWKNRGVLYAALLGFLAISIFFILFIRIDVPGLSDVSLKSGYISHVVLLLFAAVFLDQAFSGSRWKRWLSLAMLTVLVLPASVTTVLDVYNSQDISNPKFTSYITRDQMEIYKWMRRNLEPTARIQDYLQADTTFIDSFVSETPPFANASLYVGDTILARIFQTPEDELEKRRTLQQSFINSEDPRVLSHLARQGKITYILAHPGDVNPFARPDAKNYFSLVLAEGSMKLYRVLQNVPAGPSMAAQAGLLAYDEESQEILLTSQYGEGFYGAENLPDGERARWLSQDAMIHFTASRNMRGTLIFLTHSFAKPRTLELNLNGVSLASQSIGFDVPAKVAVRVEFAKGENTLRLHCPEGAAQVNKVQGGKDDRKVSFRVWQMQFRGDRR